MATFSASTAKNQRHVPITKRCVAVQGNGIRGVILPAISASQQLPLRSDLQSDIASQLDGGDHKKFRRIRTVPPLSKPWIAARRSGLAGRAAPQAHDNAVLRRSTTVSEKPWIRLPVKVISSASGPIRMPTRCPGACASRISFSTIAMDFVAP